MLRIDPAVINYDGADLYVRERERNAKRVAKISIARQSHRCTQVYEGFIDLDELNEARQLI